MSICYRAVAIRRGVCERLKLMGDEIGDGPGALREVARQGGTVSGIDFTVCRVGRSAWDQDRCSMRPSRIPHLDWHSLGCQRTVDMYSINQEVPRRGKLALSRFGFIPAHPA